jgi:hypothetical protein
MPDGSVFPVLGMVLSHDCVTIADVKDGRFVALGDVLSQAYVGRPGSGTGPEAAGPIEPSGIAPSSTVGPITDPPRLRSEWANHMSGANRQLLEDGKGSSQRAAEVSPLNKRCWPIFR